MTSQYRFTSIELRVAQLQAENVMRRWTVNCPWNLPESVNALKRLLSKVWLWIVSGRAEGYLRLENWVIWGHRPLTSSSSAQRVDLSQTWFLVEQVSCHGHATLAIIFIRLRCLPIKRVTEMEWGITFSCRNDQKTRRNKSDDKEDIMGDKKIEISSLKFLLDLLNFSAICRTGVEPIFMIVSFQTYSQQTCCC